MRAPQRRTVVLATAVAATVTASAVVAGAAAPTAGATPLAARPVAQASAEPLPGDPTATVRPGPGPSPTPPTPSPRPRPALGPGVTVSAADVVRRGVPTPVTVEVTLPNRPSGTAVALRVTAPGLTRTLTVRTSSARTATTTLTLVPPPIGTWTVTAQATGSLTGHLTRPVADAPALSAATARARWQSLTDQAASTGATAAATDGHTVAALGWQVRALAATAGWDAPAVQALLDRLVALRRPGGGYGVDDADADGNPSPQRGTTFTVTTADHAGPALLAGWQHGRVSDAVLRGALDAVVAMPRLTTASGATCVAYSDAPDGDLCVHNVSLGAAAFVADVLAATGWTVPGARELVAAVTASDADGYLPATGYWTYTDTRTDPQDADHEGYTLDAVADLDPTRAQAALPLYLGRPWWQHPAGVPGNLARFGLGLSRVVPLDCTAATSPSVLEAFAAAAASTVRMDAFHAAWQGRRVLDTCFG